MVDVYGALELVWGRRLAVKEPTVWRLLSCPGDAAIVRSPDDPVSLAPGAYGAGQVSQRDFRMLDGEGKMEFPLEDTLLAVWQITSRSVQKGRHLWRTGFGLGPQASGERANSMEAPPPALLPVGVR